MLQILHMSRLLLSMLETFIRTVRGTHEPQCWPGHQEFLADASTRNDGFGLSGDAPYKERTPDELGKILMNGYLHFVAINLTLEVTFCCSENG